MARGAPAIFAGHLWAEGGKLSSEGGLFADQSQIPAAAFAHEAFAYYALGHLHLHQQVAVPAGGPAVYAGSIGRIDFSDEGAPKGAVLVAVGTDGARRRFIPVPAREFITVAVEAENEGDVTKTAEEAAARRCYEEAVVRLRVTGPASLASHVNHAALEAAFAGAFSFRVEFTPRAVERRRRTGIPAESDLRQALTAYAREKPPAAAFSLDDLLARTRELEAAGDETP